MNEENKRPAPAGPPTSIDDVLGEMELGCWTAVFFIPFLYYVNGPAVSEDQHCIQTALVIVAYSGAPLLRLINWRRSRTTT